MERLRSGQQSALNELMTRHAGRVHRYLIRLLQDEDEAADLAQETFVRVYLHRHRFQPGRKFSTWLFAIATNLARDRLRRLNRRPQVPLDAHGPEDTGLANVLPDDSPGPEEKLEQAERAAAVRHAVAALPEELRVPLILFEYEQQSHAEIAAALGCSAKAVEMRLYRARQQLRTALSRLIGQPR
ncbi:MAG TPA: sigma-70 family RNA polymerase sigma factor [Verrucomicrobiota bacterium]|nr:sigma-70 family RNA polymerase sigma factor [Verrucomicrobiota bacterium]